MSWETYSKWWIKSKRELTGIRNREGVLIQKAQIIKERPVASHLVGGIYARYCIIVQEIDACLDQICQVQKRMTIKKLMDAATIRLNELKDELLKIDISEYHYIDGAMVELKLIPHSVEVLQPALMVPRSPEVQEMWERIQKGETIFVPPEIDPNALLESTQPGLHETPSALRLLSNLMAKKDEEAKAKEDAEKKAKEEEEAARLEAEKKGNETNEQVEADIDAEIKRKEEEEKRKAMKKRKAFAKEEKVLTPEELEALKRKALLTDAVRLVQSMERARQGRLYYLDYVRARVGRRQVEAAVRRKQNVDETSSGEAAIKIQKIWRGHAVREKMKRRERDRRLLIGMTEPSWRSGECFEKMQRTIEERRALRDRHIKDYIKANVDEKERVLRVIGPGLMEDIGDEIRDWFHQWYVRARNFDKYPPEDKGGTILVVRGETMTPEEWIDEVERRRRKNVKMRGLEKEIKRKEMEIKRKEKEEKKKREKEQKKKEKERQKKLAKKGEGFEFQFKDSAAAKAMGDAFQEHKELWSGRKDEDNPEETHYMDMITDEKCYEMQIELRKKVDELMRLELDMLNEALERDKIRLKGRRSKKKRSKKKKKGKKGKKKKGLKDLTKTRQTEDLFQELFDQGIIKTYVPSHLKDYRGDFSYQNWDRRLEEYNPPATLGDVRQAVMLNCILPLGVEVMAKPKSVLIAGSRSSGIHLLARAVFTETSCVLFDLSAENIAGKYPGRNGLKMLVHLVNKMSRILQPSVIYVDGAERPFYKKVPKGEKSLEPKRLGRQLYKRIVKTITHGDRVLVLGVSRTPWLGKVKKMNKAYERVIMVPRPDYGSVFIFWREMLMPYHGVDRDLDVTPIATLTVNYPLPVIRAAVEQVMTPRRIIQLKYKPLSLHELLEVLLDGDGPIVDKDWKKYVKWYNKTVVGKKRIRFQNVVDKKRDNARSNAVKEEMNRQKQERAAKMAALKAQKAGAGGKPAVTGGG